MATIYDNRFFSLLQSWIHEECNLNRVFPSYELLARVEGFVTPQYTSASSELVRAATLGAFLSCYEIGREDYVNSLGQIDVSDMAREALHCLCLREELAVSLAIDSIHYANALPGPDKTALQARITSSRNILQEDLLDTFEDRFFEDSLGVSCTVGGFISIQNNIIDSLYELSEAVDTEGDQEAIQQKATELVRNFFTNYFRTRPS